MNSEDMDKQLNVCHGIVIQNLPEKMKWDAVKSLEETFFILPSSVLSVTINDFGVNIVFDRYAQFFKAITKRILVVNSVKYHIYPMVTDLTVIGAGPFLSERTLKSLMSNIAPVLSVYREEDRKGVLTKNYRVIMNHPEIYEFIKLWPMDNFQIPGNVLSFPITFFCRLCRQNGHTRHQCSETQQISCSDEKSYKLKFRKEKTVSHEDFKHSPKQNTDRKGNVRVESFEEILKVPFRCDESIESKQKDKSLPLSEVKPTSQPTLFKIKDDKSETKPLQLKLEVESFEEILRVSFHCSDSIESKQKDKSVPFSEVVSQPTLFKVKDEKSETKPLQLKREVESFEEILSGPFHCDESIESKQKDKSLPLECKVFQPTLFKIKDDKFETKPLQLKREDTDQTKRPEINRCINSAVTDEKNIKSTSQRNKNDSPRSKVFKTPHTNVDSHKNVSLKCKKSKKNQKVRFSKLIPPELHIIASPLKELFLSIVKETFSQTIYTKAKSYPYGVNVLLHHMSNVVQFNLKEISTKTSPERRFIFWIDSMLTKITEEHSRNNLEKYYLGSSSNLKLESYNNTQDGAYLSKCNMVTNDLKNDTFKKNYFKEDIKVFTEQKDMHEHIKAKMNFHESFQNKDTLNAFQKKKVKFSNNTKQIRQDVNLESVIKNIKLNLKKNEEHCPSESILNKKRHTNQTEKVNVRRTKKHCGIKDACGDGIQVTNLDLQTNKISRTMNEVCNKKSVPYLKDQINVQNQKCCAVQRVSVENISTYPEINMDEHNNRIRCSMKELCVEKGVQYPGAKIDVQKNSKSCEVKRVAEEKIVTHPAINMDGYNDKINCSMKQLSVGKNVQYPGVKIDVLKNQQSCAVKRVAEKNSIAHSALNMDGHNDKIRCSMKEFCVGKDVQYPGVKIDVLKNQKSCAVKRVAGEKINTYPALNMDGYNNKIRCSMKEFCVRKDVKYPGVKIDVLKNQKSCAVKRVAEGNNITHPDLNMDGHNDKINCSMKEFCVGKDVQYPGVKIDVLKNQQSCAVKRVAEKNSIAHPALNMDGHNDKIRCSMKEFCVGKDVQYPGVKIDVLKNQKSCAVKNVVENNRITHPALNMDDHNDKINCSMKEFCVRKNFQYPGVKIDVLKNQQSCAVKRVVVEKFNTYSVINMDEHNDNIKCFMKEFCVEEGVQYPGAKMNVQKNQEMVVNEEKRGVFIGQRTLYQATKMGIQKDSHSATSSKTGHKKQPKTGKLSAKYSPGLLAAIRSSKGILKPSELKMFLIHVKGKTHVRQMAKNYSLEVNKLVEQLEVIVSKHYRGLRVIAPTSKEIAWIKELIERLKAHENCETCQK